MDFKTYSEQYFIRECWKQDLICQITTLLAQWKIPLNMKKPLITFKPAEMWDKNNTMNAAVQNEVFSEVANDVLVEWNRKEKDSGLYLAMDQNTDSEWQIGMFQKSNN